MAGGVTSLASNPFTTQANKAMARNSAQAGEAINRVSSGSKFVKPSSDAAGAALSKALRAAAGSMRQGNENAAQGAALIQVASGGLDAISTLLQRMKVLTTKVVSEALDANAKAYTDKEYQQLLTEVTTTAERTRFNGQSLLQTTGAVTPTAGLATAGVHDITAVGANAETYSVEFAEGTDTWTITGLTSGDSFTAVVADPGADARTNVSFSNGIKFELDGMFDHGSDIAVGAGHQIAVAAGAANGTFSFLVGEVATDTINVSIGSSDATDLSINGTDVLNTTNANTANTALDAAIVLVNNNISELGAQQARLEMTIARLDATISNTDAAEATISNSDIAADIEAFNKFNALTQAGIGMAVKSNSMVEQLLRYVQ